MPYIPPESRPTLDEAMAGLIAHLRTLPLEEQDGALNYTITRLLKSLYPARYFHYNRAMGVLESIKQEFYRTDIAPYEDQKRQANGPVVAAPSPIARGHQ
jgi:hypothetical protein